MTYYAINPDSGLIRGNEALQLSIKLKYQDGMAMAYSSLGVNYDFGKSNSEKAIFYYLKALGINIANNNKRGIASNYSNLAIVYSRKDRYKEALDYFYKALRLHEELGNKRGISGILVNMANIYEDQKEYAKALDMHMRSLGISEEIGNKSNMAIALSNCGNIYYLQGNLEKAKYYFEKALNQYKALEMKLGIATEYSNLAKIESNNLIALDLLDKSLAIKKELGMDKNIHSIFFNKGSIYYKMAQEQNTKNSGLDVQFGGNRIGALQQAKVFMDSAIQNCKMNNEIRHLQNYYTEMSNVEAILNQYDSALLSYKNAILYKDSIYNFENTKEIAKANLQYEYEKKEILLKAEQQKKELELKKNIEISALNFEYERRQALAKTQEETQKLKFEQKERQLELERKFEIEKDSLEEVNKMSEMARIEDERKRKEQSYILQIKQEERLSYERLKRKLLISGFAFTGLLSIFAFVQYKKRQKIKRLLEVEETKTNIRKDLHDDLGTTLSTISMQTEVAKKRIKNHEDVSDLIENIQKASNKSVGQMSDIVWSLHPENISLSQCWDRIKDYCAISLTPYDMEYSCILDPSLNGYPLDSSLIKELYLFTKEAITNAMKYSKATKLIVRAEKKSNAIAISITDNGIGFDANSQKISLGGEGLKNMKARALKIKATFEIISELGKGTEVILQLSNG
ncbi:MAG: tetratricopeptide repeat protein [Chitinophagaceae bacterium]